jgi:hypothetical protein
MVENTEVLAVSSALGWMIHVGQVVKEALTKSGVGSGPCFLEWVYAL